MRPAHCPAIAVELQDEFRAAVLAYYREVERCSFRLLEAFCAGLGMERTALHHLFEVGCGLLFL
jgi:isopenicillin N synthase-like dioxygenase